ncbi:MAG: TIM barrel protein [Kiritimatiellae bacterium]|nr:TIM barrel protein [Kiritimatiellia bacterium]
MLMTRREHLRLLGLAAAGAAASPLRGLCGAEGGAPLFAVQLYSIHKILWNDPARIFAALKEAGYDGVEFAGYAGRIAKDIKALLADAGLVGAGTHVNGNVALVGDELSRTLDFCAEAGLESVTTPHAKCDDEDAYRRFGHKMGLAAEAAAKYGIKVGIHTTYHHFTTKYGDRTAWDAIYSDASPLLQQQVDTGNTFNTGTDVVALLKKYRNRHHSIHLKENVPTVDGVFGVPPTDGGSVVPWKDVFDYMGTEIGHRWYIVEAEGRPDSLEPCLENRRWLRRYFALGSVAAASAASKKLTPAASSPKPEFAWSFLAHFGMNMWGDIVSKPGRDGLIKKRLTDEEFALVCGDDYLKLDRVRFEERLWRDLSTQLQKDGCNQIVVDVGEFLRYPSHPELAVKGSWSPERLSAEVRRLNGMGFEVVPKLNFSCCHRTWLGPYSRMISTPKYYEVCSDVIRDTLEVFKGTRFLHIGMDEEHMPDYQKYNTMLIVRQGDLWWHDALWLVKEVEKHGVRAWMWHDYLRKGKIADFERRMPKSVVQSPWTYQIENTTRYENLLWTFKALADAGYDTIPCSSHCYGGDEGFVKIAEWCRKNMNPEHWKGYMMAPWMQTGEAYRRLLFRGSELIAEARKA